jgi:hypothetical protein
LPQTSLRVAAVIHTFVVSDQSHSPSMVPLLESLLNLTRDGGGPDWVAFIIGEYLATRSSREAIQALVKASSRASQRMLNGVTESSD